MRKCSCRYVKLDLHCKPNAKTNKYNFLSQQLVREIFCYLTVYNLILYKIFFYVKCKQILSVNKYDNDFGPCILAKLSQKDCIIPWLSLLYVQQRLVLINTGSKKTLSIVQEVVHPIQKIKNRPNMGGCFA